MALRAKNRSDEAESAGFGDSKLKDDNEVWADFSPQPSGTGPIFPISLLLVAPVTGYSSLLAPRTEKNWRPSPPSEVMFTGPGFRNQIF
jgi:hypothetical protein